MLLCSNFLHSVIWKTTGAKKGKVLTKNQLHRAKINIEKTDYKQYCTLITQNILFYFNGLRRCSGYLSIYA